MKIGLYIGRCDDYNYNIFKNEKFRAKTSAVREEESSVVADAFFIGNRGTGKAGVLHRKAVRSVDSRWSICAEGIL